MPDMWTMSRVFNYCRIRQTVSVLTLLRKMLSLTIELILCIMWLDKVDIPLPRRCIERQQMALMHSLSDSVNVRATR